MSASSDARQKAMDVNRSLRTIKTELEKLLELGAIDDDEFNGIHDQLPQEWSLRGGPPAAAKHKAVASAEQQQQQPAAAQHPPLPVRNNNREAPEPTPREEADVTAPGEAVLGYASAKYKYDAPNDGDLAFERSDAVAVYNKINDDWWRGRNVRTGGVGIFPRQYIKPDDALAELERTNQLDAPPSGPPPGTATRSASTAYADTNSAPPPAYQPSQQNQYGGAADAKYEQPYYAGQQAPYMQQAYSQPLYGQPGYVQPTYAQQAPYYGGGGPSQPQQLQQQPPPQDQQQQQQPQAESKLKGSGKKIGGKLGNAFVTGVGFAAGAELVGAIL